MKPNSYRGLALLAALMLLLAPFFCRHADADDAKQQVMVDEAAIMLNDFLNDGTMAYLRDNIRYAKGLLFIPSLFKGAFVFGGSGGRGLLMVRDPKTNQWSGPAFYTIGGGSWGLQIGASASAVIMMVMTQRGLDSLYTSNIKLGGGVSVAAGPVGIGAEGATAPNLSADFISFARSKGAFIGISLEGAVIAVNDEYNQTYYGRAVRPVDIFERKDISNPQSANLRDRLAGASRR